MPARRLAAIMFTDIAGYTRLMQESEARAAQIRQRHRQVFEHFHERFNGQILQYYGDGTLSIFDSCVEAVKCATAVQQELQKTPSAPLRIGIHLGDIVRTENDIYGDGVNIASRVESLGTAGAVLISGEVRKQIKNQEIETVPLGSFEMKNVAVPVELFAVKAPGLVVPQPQEMQGKATRIEKVPSSSPARQRVWFASLAFAVIAFGVALFWFFSIRKSDGLLAESIREERVAVIPFKNIMGDPELDVLGDYCGLLITMGLTEAGIKTCSQRAIEQYHHLEGVPLNDPEGKVSYSEVTGARYVIEGVYAVEGDSVTIKSQLTDAWTWEPVRNFQDVRGPIEQKEKLVDRLARRLMSYWVAKDVIDAGKFRPPLWEAFQEYQKIFTEGQGGWAPEYSLKAFGIDSTFYLAALEEFFWQADGQRTGYDSLYNLLAPHYKDMTPFEQSFFNSSIALHERDYFNYLKYREEQFEMFPKDFSINSHYSFHLFTRENQPGKAWEVVNTIDWANISDDFKDLRTLRIAFMCWVGLGAGQYDEVINLANSYLKGTSLEGSYYLYKSIALLRSGQIDAVYEMLEEVKKLKKPAIGLHQNMTW